MPAPEYSAVDRLADAVARLKQNMQREIDKAKDGLDLYVSLVRAGRLEPDPAEFTRFAASLGAFADGFAPDPFEGLPMSPGSRP